MANHSKTAYRDPISRQSFLLPLLFLFFLATRIVPYLINPIPRGYDGGIYLLAMRLFPTLPSWLAGTYYSAIFLLTYPFTQLGIAPESLFIPLAVLSQITLFAAMYWSVKRVTNTKTALFTVFLLAVSAIQFRTYWFLYIKNTFGLACFIASMTTLATQKPVRWLIFFGSLCATVHPPTAILLVPTIGIEFLMSKERRRNLLLACMGIASITILFYLPYIETTIFQYIRPFFIQTFLKGFIPVTNPGGAFYTIPQTIPLIIFSAPLAIYGLYACITKKNHTTVRPFIIFFCISTAMILTQSSFYQRYLITWDIAAIIIGGIGLSVLWDTYKQYRDSIVFGMVLSLLFLMGFIIKTGEPLIDQNLLTEIKSFHPGPNAVILSTDKADHAWLMGYTNSPVIAWDFGGENRYWTYEEWETFFTSENVSGKEKLLQKLPQPLYIFINNTTYPLFKALVSNPCVNAISPHFYSYTCRQ